MEKKVRIYWYSFRLHQCRHFFSLFLFLLFTIYWHFIRFLLNGWDFRAIDCVCRWKLYKRFSFFYHLSHFQFEQSSVHCICLQCFHINSFLFFLYWEWCLFHVLFHIIRHVWICVSGTIQFSFIPISFSFQFKRVHNHIFCFIHSSFLQNRSYSVIRI